MVEDYKRMKPLIRKNKSTGEMIAGFLDPVSGVYHTDMEVANDKDIDTFLDKYNLTVVMVSKV